METHQVLHSVFLIVSGKLCRQKKKKKDDTQKTGVQTLFFLMEKDDNINSSSFASVFCCPVTFS